MGADAIGLHAACLGLSSPRADLARALVAADADIRSLAEPQHSLEDVCLELVDDEVEAKSRRARVGLESASVSARSSATSGATTS